MPPFRSDMHCFGYFDGDVTEDRVFACFADEFEIKELSKSKQIRVEYPMYT